MTKQQMIEFMQQREKDLWNDVKACRKAWGDDAPNTRQMISEWISVRDLMYDMGIKQVR